MMFLTDLPSASHRRVISNGFVLAGLLRIGTTLATSRLLEAFAPLQVVLAVLVLGKGLQMLWEAWRRSYMAEGSASADGVAPPPSLENHGMVRALRRCVLIQWSDETDAQCIICERAESPSTTGCCCCLPRCWYHCHLTRTTVLAFAIGVSDLTFSSDNIAAALALTTDPFALVVSFSLSILLLRPVFFLLAAFVRYLDALDSALGVILVLIGVKLCLALAGIETPLWIFAGLLTAWRLVVMLFVIFS